MSSKSRLLKVFGTVLALALFTSTVYAAPPDGAIGPWADEVVTSSQGLTKNGGAVPANRSDPTSALGVAENDTVDGNFFSLGFGGSITLRFDNGISSGVFFVEATNPNYPLERADVEISEDGSVWFAAGQVVQDGLVNVPQGVSCATYVRITDASDPNDFTEDTADAYDIDGVEAQGEPCNPPTPTPTVLGATDVCENLDGIQTSLPAGLHFDNSGKKCLDWAPSGAPPPLDSPASQVLGASTLGAAGETNEQIIALLFAVGVVFTYMGIRRNASFRNKADQQKTS